MAGNNSQEGSYQQLLGDQALSQKAYHNALKSLYPEHHETVFTLYPGK